MKKGSNMATIVETYAVDGILSVEHTRMVAQNVPLLNWVEVIEKDYNESVDKYFNANRQYHIFLSIGAALDYINWIEGEAKRYKVLWDNFFLCSHHRVPIDWMPNTQSGLIQVVQI